jgi:hypothetical protein
VKGGRLGGLERRAVVECRLNLAKSDHDTVFFFNPFS